MLQHISQSYIKFDNIVLIISKKNKIKHIFISTLADTPALVWFQLFFEL